MRVVEFDSPPADYYAWTKCLEELENGLLDEEAENILAQGTCPEYGGIKPYIHGNIEKAVNSSINSCIKELRRDVLLFTENNEIQGLHMAFIRFSKRIRRCLFFTRIPFLDSDYKDELYKNTRQEVMRIWNAALASMKKDAAKGNSPLLDEELFLIERIRIFDK